MNGLPHYKLGVAPEPKARVQRWVRLIKAHALKTILWTVAIAAAGAGLYWRVPVVNWSVDKIAQATGARVEQVTIEGAVYTTREQLNAALALQKGDALVGFDARAARARLEKLPWVRLAAVERQLPANIKVSLYEHVPLAIIKQDGKSYIVTKDGALISPDITEGFGTLPELRGTGSAAAAPKLFALLAEWPTLQGQLKHVTWVGERRWDLVFASGVTVRLPETDPAQALQTLNTLEQTRHILTLNAGTVDLRLPDRVILQLPADVKDTPVTNKPATEG
ncbi:MAG TPA: cell division protein FtsQ/DivIB [Alphaproteobacteria bacterium]|nr:cell division protein FtsQ/DivIB [Alphaproteobacteria bacterium]